PDLCQQGQAVRRRNHDARVRMGPDLYARQHRWQCLVLSRRQRGERRRWFDGGYPADDADICSAWRTAGLPVRQGQSPVVSRYRQEYGGWLYGVEPPVGVERHPYLDQATEWI